MVDKRHLRYKPSVYGQSADLQNAGSETVAACPLCGRPLPDDKTTDEHHLVPRSQGGREKFRLHRVCHQKIHATLTERELARHYNNWESLRAHPDIATFIEWVSKRPPDYLDRNRKTKAMRRR
jgi:hypothetical protein